MGELYDTMGLGASCNYVHVGAFTLIELKLEPLKSWIQTLVTDILNILY